MGLCGHKEAGERPGHPEGVRPWDAEGPGLYDKRRPKGFSAEKDKGIYIWSLSKTAWGCGRERKIAFKISPVFVFLKGPLASFWGEPHPAPEAL